MTGIHKELADNDGLIEIQGFAIGIILALCFLLFWSLPHLAYSLKAFIAQIDQVLAHHFGLFI